MKFIKKLSIVLFAIMGLVACDVEGDLLEDQYYSQINVSLIYTKNTDYCYRVNFGETLLADSLYSANSDFAYKSFASAYISADQLSDTLKVWRYIDSTTLSLEVNTFLTYNPSDGFINLVQIVDSGKIILPPTSTLSDVDTTKTSFFFLHNDDNQPEQVFVEIMAVDYYSLIMNGSNLVRVPDSLKEVVAHMALTKNEFSQEVILDNNYFAGKTENDYGCNFFFAIYDENDSLIQDYDNGMKITLEYINGSINAIYKKKLMQFPYKSASQPFKSPTIFNDLFNEKW